MKYGGAWVLITKRFQILWKIVLCIVLLEHYGSELPAETRPVGITVISDLLIEWKTFWQYINQGKLLRSNRRSCPANFVTQSMFPNSSILAKVCPSIPVEVLSEKSTWRSQYFIYLMKIVLESPEALSALSKFALECLEELFYNYISYISYYGSCHRKASELLTKIREQFAKVILQRTREDIITNYVTVKLRSTHEVL